MTSPIWKMEEIHALEEFGANSGWFYGFVRWEGKIHFGEIFPGLGFGQAFPQWSPRCWIWMIKDVYRATKRK